jgi:hypothetical protein
LGPCSAVHVDGDVAVLVDGGMGITRAAVCKPSGPQRRSGADGWRRAARGGKVNSSAACSVQRVACRASAEQVQSKCRASAERVQPGDEEKFFSRRRVRMLAGLGWVPITHTMYVCGRAEGRAEGTACRRLRLSGLGQGKRAASSESGQRWVDESSRARCFGREQDSRGPRRRLVDSLVEDVEGC